MFDVVWVFAAGLAGVWTAVEVNAWLQLRLYRGRRPSPAGDSQRSWLGRLVGWFVR